MAWYDKNTLILADEARIHILEAYNSRANNTTYDQVKSAKLHYANAYWWLYEYKQGQGEQEIRNLVSKYLHNPAVQANKDDIEHQRLARIAGYWVPGRRPGVPNKVNPNKQPRLSAHNAGNSQNTSKNTGNFTVAHNTIRMHGSGTITGVSTAPADIARLIDTGSLSTPEVWAVIVALLQAATKDSRGDEHLEIIQDTITVLYPLTQPKF